jgi:hypothetical protein
MDWLCRLIFWRLDCFSSAFIGVSEIKDLAGVSYVELSETNDLIISFFFYRIDLILEVLVICILNKIIYKVLTAVISQYNHIILTPLSPQYQDYFLIQLNTTHSALKLSLVLSNSIKINLSSSQQ